MKKVSNPLTIVGIFATIAETVATVVLPKLSPDLQNIFIWFVMLFPVLLITLFFLTWNFNVKVMYAPNDFNDERNYIENIKILRGIKNTIDNEKQNGNKPEETIIKVYDNVVKQIDRIENPDNEIIRVLSKKPEGMTTKEIAEELGMNINMINRRIQMLSVLEVVKTDFSEGRRRVKYKLKQ